MLRMSLLALFATCLAASAAELESRALTHYLPQDQLESIVRKEGWHEIVLKPYGGVRKGDKARIWAGGLIDRGQLLLRSIPLQKRWLALAEQYLDSDDKEVRNMAAALFQHCGRLFTFLEHPGVEPTNNCAEQALRIAVQLRKIVFGNRSAQGEVATARLLTVTQTCRMQGRNALGYLTEAIIHYRRRQSAPSLLPQQK